MYKCRVMAPGPNQKPGIRELDYLLPPHVKSVSAARDLHRSIAKHVPEKPTKRISESIGSRAQNRDMEVFFKPLFFAQDDGVSVAARLQQPANSLLAHIRARKEHEWNPSLLRSSIAEAHLKAAYLLPHLLSFSL